MDLVQYAALLDSIKQRVRLAQTSVMLAANRQMIELYWDMGGLIHARQQSAAWGAGVLRKLAADLKTELPETRRLGHSPWPHRKCPSTR